MYNSLKFLDEITSLIFFIYNNYVYYLVQLGNLYCPRSEDCRFDK